VSTLGRLRPRDLAKPLLGFRRLSDRMLSAAGIERTEQAYVLRYPEQLPDGAGAAVAVLWLALLLLINLIGIVRFPYFGPTSLVEEVTYTYTSANNYLRYGFLNSGLLQDFSSSSRAVDHPYIYNHMPPGPDIFTALVLQGSDGSYRAVRLAYTTVFVIGIAFFVKFVRLVLSGARLRGAGFAVLFLGPWMIVQNFERHTASPQPLLIFAPLVALGSYYRTGHRRYEWLAFAGVLASAFYLDYNVLSGVSWCWVLLCLTQLVRLDRRHLAAFLVAVAAGIGLHLLQNFLYLGSAFWQELPMLLSNRVRGWPTQEEMKTFYQSIGVVHHGSRAPDWIAVLKVMKIQMWFFGQKVIFLTGAVALGWLVARYARRNPDGSVVLSRGEATADLAFFAKLLIWANGTVILAQLTFPAFTQEVNLYGARTNLLFQAVVGVAVLSYTVRGIVRWHPFRTLTGRSEERGVTPMWLAEAAIWLVLVAGVLLGTRAVVDANGGELHQLVSDFYQHKNRFLADAQRFDGEVFMTNINTPPVAFFVRERGHGVCGPESIEDGGVIDVGSCKVAFMRTAPSDPANRPRYFFLFWSRELFPGFADCLPSGALIGQERGEDCISLMRARLSVNFERVFKNELFEVYDLRSKRAVSRSGSWSG